MTAAAIALICVVYALWAPAIASLEMIDHRLFRLAVDSMRDSAGYYEAMEAAIGEVYGAERAAVTETIRGFRMPTTFVAWSLLPNERAVWFVYVAWTGLTGILAIGLTRRPLLAVVVVVYLLSIGMLLDHGLWTAQFMTVELWAVLPMIAAVAFATRRQWWRAALLALAATLIRETAAPLLLAGAALAMIGRLPRKPWLGSLALATLAYAAHAVAASPFIDRSVNTPLLGDDGIPMSVLRIMGFGLPFEIVLGPVLWVLAVWLVKTSYEDWMVAAAPLALPLVGLIVDRPYWGILVVPFTLVWGLDKGLELITTMIRGTQTPIIPGDEPSVLDAG